MNRAEMDRLIKIHIEAEKAADTAQAVSVYSDDVEHDVVGTPHAPLRGREAARGFYDQLVRAIHTETMEPTRSHYGDDFCVMEHQWAGTVPGPSWACLERGAGSPSDSCTFGSSATDGSAARTSGSTVETSYSS